jgi:hypothetical protein
MTLNWVASELLTSRKFTDKRPIVVFKNGRQSFSSTTSDQFDADLKITLPQTSATYLVEANYGTSGDPAADIVLAWNVTGGATVTRTTQALETAGLSTADALIMCREMSTAGWSSGTVLTFSAAVREKLIVDTSSEPCTLTLVWHQNVSNATWTSVNDYGWAVARRLA